MARLYTGSLEMISLRNGYHGGSSNTMSLTALNTWKYPIPQVYDIVRKAGGVSIADEVQTGFGRTRSHFWGFETQGVIPDIVTMAKGIGNGLPLGAVVTIPEIASVLAQKTQFNTYVVVMDRLVNTPKDVELLVKYGIVENRLGDSSGGSTLISNLADGVIFDSKNFCYAALCKDLNNYCSWTWHKWKANLRQNYFNTPWAVISFTAAVILLILTLVQAVCSVISATQQ